MSLRIRMTVTVPKEILNVGIVRREIARTMQRKTAMDLKTEFRKTTFGWSKKPFWSQKFEDRAGYMAESVFPTGPNAKQYALVNEGAKPHDIPPRAEGGWLKFKVGYRASTRPRVISSRRNYRFGPYRYAKGVGGRFSGFFHPGFEGRKFDETIAEEYYDTFHRDIMDAIGRSIRLSGS